MANAKRAVAEQRRAAESEAAAHEDERRHLEVSCAGWMSHSLTRDVLSLTTPHRGCQPWSSASPAHHMACEAPEPLFALPPLRCPHKMTFRVARTGTTRSFKCGA